MTDLAKWQSHKIVSAGKITYYDGAGREDGPESTVHAIVEGPYGESFHYDIPFAVVQRGAPAVGDYYVIYEDGYTSWSPASAFEGGYTRVHSTDK